MRNYVLVAAVSVALTSLFFVSQNGQAQQSQATAKASAAQPAAVATNPAQAPTLKLNEPLPANIFIELAKAINPAVVNISTSALARREVRDPMQEMLERFYGVPSQDDGWSNKPRRVGLGTGFIIREDGLIVTNAHVIRGADIIEVQLTENSEKQYTAEVIGSDARTDIALIKIKPDIKLTVASLGSSKDLEVGEWVAAFGNPYGHGHTMTKGIVSSKGRAIREINKFPLIQTDASINPGNSGGPLVNTKGFVVGINSAIDARAQGIGFAIPIDEVKAILPDLEKTGSIKRGYIGVELGDLDRQTVRYLNLDDDNRGAIVGNVLTDSPADKAGLKPYDVIFEVDGQKVADAADLSNKIADVAIGSKVKVKFYRNNRGQALEKIATITVEERPTGKDSLKQRRNRR